MALRKTPYVHFVLNNICPFGENMYQCLKPLISSHPPNRPVEACRIMFDIVIFGRHDGRTGPLTCHLARSVTGSNG
jgi:hypothetical protein